MAGDRISVEWRGEHRYGTIVEQYSGSHSHNLDDLTFYAVEWDDQPGVVERGYLGVSFTKFTTLGGLGV